MKKLIDELNDINDNITESSAKAIFALIPVIGGAVSSIIGDYQTARKINRLAEFGDDLREDLEELKEKINIEFVKKDDFLDIFEETAENIANCRVKEKRIAFKNILKNSSVRSTTYDEIEDFIDLLRNLRENHMNLLRLFFKPYEMEGDRNYGHGSFLILNTLASKLNLDIEYVQDLLAKLKQERLVVDTIGNTNYRVIDAKIIDITKNITGKGQRFCEFIFE